MTSTDAIEFATLRDISARIRRREVSSVEVSRLLLHRIEALDPRLSSFAHLSPDAAMRDAEKADREIASGFLRGPLHGVPIAVKDLIHIRDQPTGCGMPIRSDWRSAGDATVVSRLRRGGAVLLGKTQMTEGAAIAHHPGIVAPVNPWAADRCSGFSSSGSGVAVAAGLCYAAIGSDTGGSIRIPAAANGTTGIKPSWGRVSRHGIFPLVEAYDTVGPLARNAADTAAVLAAISGQDPQDPTATPDPVPHYLATIDSGIGGITIGLDRESLEASSDPQIVHVITEAATILADLGASLRIVDMPEFDMLPILPLMSASMIAGHRESYPAQADRYGPHLRGMLDQAMDVRGTDVADALCCVDRFCGELAILFSGIDLLLLPVLTRPTPKAGDVEHGLMENPADIFGLVRYTGPINISRRPAIALRGGTDKGGMPIGFQLVGRPFEEALLFRAAHAFQRITDWHTLRPPLDS